MNVPEDLRYSSDHEWVGRDGDVVRIGITDYAQDALGDVVFVQAPDVGTEVAAGESFGEVESTKSVSDSSASRTARPTNTPPSGWYPDVTALANVVMSGVTP